MHRTGVLLTGASGSGKSTLALELVARGHALVADDVVELRRVGRSLIGRAAPLLKGYLAVRALGVLDIRAMYGGRAIRGSQKLDLIIHLSPRRHGRLDLLRARRGEKKLLGITVPSLSLPAGHNLPTLVEAACLDQCLRQSGISAELNLAERQRRMIDKTGMRVKSKSH